VKVVVARQIYRRTRHFSFPVYSVQGAISCADQETPAALNRQSRRGVHVEGLHTPKLDPNTTAAHGNIIAIGVQVVERTQVGETHHLDLSAALVFK